jgi:branched-chain amino acid transport system substrate-binding protein
MIVRLPFALSMCTLLIASATPAFGANKPKATTPALTPITIGFKNLEGGPISLTQIRIGFEEGVKYVNEQLGGINGHPIKIDFCKVDGSPESSIKCANQFIESRVAVIVQGVDPSADAALKIEKEAGLAQVALTAMGPQQQQDVGHSFVFASPGAAANLGALVAMKNAGAKKVRFFQDDSPSGRQNNDKLLKPAAKKLGMDADTIFFPATGADWTSLLATAMSTKPDGLGTLVLGESGCAAMVSAISKAKFKGVVLAGQCKQYVKTVGVEKAVGVLTFADQYPPDIAASAPKVTAGNLQIYQDRMTRAKHQDLIDGFAQNGFGLAVDLKTALSGNRGAFTKSSVTTTLKSAKGSRFMAGQFNCDGTVWPNSSSCSMGMLVMRQKADGAREVVGKGFLDLSKYR